MQIELGKYSVLECQVRKTVVTDCIRLLHSAVMFIRVWMGSLPGTPTWDASICGTNKKYFAWQ